MTSPALPLVASKVESTWTSATHGLVRVAIMNTLIAVSLWAAGTGSIDVQMVYSQSIGLTIWFIIQAGVLLLNRDQRIEDIRFPTGWRAMVLVAVAILGGWSLGSFVGNWYSGADGAKWFHENPRALSGLFLMTVSIGLMATYHFYVAGKGVELERALEASRRQSAESHLMLLQSQLEPHMLFNTLANLRVLIATEPQQALQMLDRFNDYLRATLSASRSTSHSLQAEFDRLDDYLSLMAIRMGPRLQTQLSLPEALATLPVPTLLLQPLVENSIKHGLEPSVGGGRIDVSARLEGGMLIVEVSDTGVGLAPDFDGSGGFGLTQVRERLQTLFGGRAALQLLPKSGGGTLARVALPMP